MKDSGKGGDSRRSRKKHPKRRGKENAQPQNRAHHGEASSKSKSRKAVNFALVGEGKFTRKRTSSTPRPKWAPTQPPALDLPSVTCLWCGKPIKEFSTALTDPESGKPVHFDCAVSRISERENLEKGDAIGYIGGGRFGVIHFSNPQNAKKFKIKKILEWENNEIRSEWRVTLCEHFSVT